LDAGSDNHLSGLGDIMIGIGGALMALSIFVYESIARKRHYFDKYYLTGLTNNIVLTILYFVGLLGLLLVYVFEDYVWVKIFLEPTLYCYVFWLIFFAGIRFYKTGIGLMKRKKGFEIEKSIISDYFEKLENEKSNNLEDHIFLLKDIFADTIKKLKEDKIDQVKDDWEVINFYFEKLFEVSQKNLKLNFQLNFFGIFLYKYFHHISNENDLIDYNNLISYPRKIFEIILEKKYLIKKGDYESINSFQYYLYYYQAMYHKGFEMQEKQKSIADILLDRSRRFPRNLANFLLSNYKSNKINAEFFENYAKEFLIYFRDLAKKCFENNDVNGFKKVIENLLKLFWRDEKDRIKKDDENFDIIGDKLPLFKSIYLYDLASFILYKTNEINFEKNIVFLNNCVLTFNTIFLHQSYIVQPQEESDYFLKLFFKISPQKSNLNLWLHEDEDFITMKEVKNKKILNRFFVYNFLIILKDNKSYNINSLKEFGDKNKLSEVKLILADLKKQIELYPNFLTVNYPDGKIDIIIKLLARDGVFNIADLIERCEKIFDDFIKKI